MTEPDQPRSPFTRRGFIAAGAVVALIVVAALAVAFTGGDDSKPPRAEGGPAAATPSQSSSANSSGCDQPAGSQLPPVAAPQSKWELVGKLVAPTAPDGAGPGKTAPNGLRSCFAHDPTGALFAAVNWLGTTTDEQLAPLAFESLTAPGPGRDTVQRMFAADPSSVLGKNPGGFQVSGFTFLTYTGDVAMMNIAVASLGGGQGSLPVTLQWSGSDWMLELPADGQIGNQIQRLDSLAGYVPWSGS